MNLVLQEPDPLDDDVFKHFQARLDVLVGGALRRLRWCCVGLLCSLDGLRDVIVLIVAGVLGLLCLFVFLNQKVDSAKVLARQVVTDTNDLRLLITYRAAERPWAELAGVFLQIFIFAVLGPNHWFSRSSWPFRHQFRKRGRMHNILVVNIFEMMLIWVFTSGTVILRHLIQVLLAQGLHLIIILKILTGLITSRIVVRFSLFSFSVISGVIVK